MKNLILSIIAFCMNTVIAQDSVQIINYYDDTYKPRIKETYWVQANDSSIKVGPYLSYFKSGQIWISGNYFRGNKVGVWLFNDIQTWEPYLKYDFDNDTELYYNSTLRELEGEYFTFKNDSIILISKNPYCPDFLPKDSFEGLKEYFKEEINKQKLVSMISNTCLVNLKITITVTGNINSEVVRSTCSNDVVEKILLIANTSPKWVAAESDGKEINYEIVLPLKLIKNEP